MLRKISSYFIWHFQRLSGSLRGFLPTFGRQSPSPLTPQLILGYLIALFIGTTLGLLGAGGAILATPVLVYLFGIEPHLATAYSLFIVGCTALVGSVSKFRKREVEVRMGLIVLIPALIGSYMMRRYGLHLIPENILTIAGATLTKGHLIMLLLAVAMLLGGISMIRPQRLRPSESRNYPMLALLSLGIGIFSGFVGIGGGFFYLPVLVLAAGMTMRHAVGTSLFVIALNSLGSFMGDVGAGQHIDYHFLMGFTGATVLGMFLGLYIAQFIAAEKLKKGFGSILLMGSIGIVLQLITHPA